MLLLILGLAIFLGTHLFTAARAPRAALVGRIGEGPYKGLYSLVSLLGIVLVAYGFGRYRAEGWVDVWYPPVWTRHLALLLVWAAFVCVTAAYLPGRIKRALKHPMLAGVKIWALAHLLANGDLGSILLFGSILAWAVIARITLKRRQDEVVDRVGDEEGIVRHAREPAQRCRGSDRRHDRLVCVRAMAAPVVDRRAGLAGSVELWQISAAEADGKRRKSSLRNRALLAFPSALW